MIPTDRRPAAEPVAVSLLAGAAGLGGSFAVAGYTPAFVAGPIAGALARAMPGAVVTFGIVVLGDLGKQLNLVLAIGLGVGLLGAAAYAGRVVGRRADSDALGHAAGFALAGLLAYAVTGAVLASLVAGLATGTVAALASAGGSLVPVSRPSPARRRVLAGAAGALGFVLGGYLLGSAGRDADGDTPAAQPVFDVPPPVRADIEANLAEAAGTSLAVEGLEPLVSDDFYRVDVNATPPVVHADDWELRVTGAVDREVSYSYADVTGREPENRFVTLRCVGESLNGRKMDNALWTGIPIMDLIEPAGVRPGCCVMLRAADNFFEEFPLEALRDGFLAYGMNGELLPRPHGFPARALIPGHWGEINVKWLTEIEILEEEQDGYWERRGWHGTGPVNTVAKLHVENRLDDGRMEVGGHAYAGTRGIERVEVSTDGGSSWVEATLSAPLPGDDVWRQWVHRYDPPDRLHDVVVRAVDGTGALQPEEHASAFPSGPSGWVRRRVRP